jgi:hypothetical protein
MGLLESFKPVLPLLVTTKLLIFIAALIVRPFTFRVTTEVGLSKGWE